MNLLDNTINKRLISGSFPIDKLYPDDEYSPHACDLEELGKNGLNVFREYPVLMYGLFKIFEKNVKEVELLKNPKCFEQEVNILINTGYSVDDLNIAGQIYLEAIKLCPVITDIDKVLWYGAWVYYFSSDIMPNDVHYKEYQDMMYAWIYLLKLVQKKELEYGLVINTDRITAKTNILKLIETNWHNIDKKYFSKLTGYDVRRLKEISESVKQLSERIKEDNASQKKVADETDNEWREFLNLLNDLSEKENNVICRINRAGSPKDKIRIINEYNSALKGIERAKYTVNGEEINLLSLYEIINERMQNAPVYCVVKTGDGICFRLHPAAFILAMKPETYNYLFITFHEFRLNPRKDTAKKFASLALSIIKRNLGDQENNHISLDDIIVDFYRTVVDFVKNNSDAIERIAFDKIQDDFAAVLPDILCLPGTANFLEDLGEGFKEIKQSEEYYKKIEKLIAENGHMLTLNEAVALAHSEEIKLERIEQKALASRIVYSLNIVYMFCEALRIMLTNHHANIKIKYREDVKKYRRDLLNIDDRLVHTVYAHLGEQEIGMLEYREKSGINITSLIEQEREEESYRNSIFGDILKDSILSLIDSIDNQDTECILKTKVRIRKKILRYPDCDEKERYTEWLDGISLRLSKALVANYQKEEDYQRIKQRILLGLGPKAHILPESTLNSLTTAEMLYAKYASDEYAAKGFDFSCISALYYQSFEEAYNILIWKGYADELNLLEINGQKYTDILETCKWSKINPSAARGYLDSNSKQRSYYIEYSNRTRLETKVNTRCMYGSFVILLKNVKPSTELNYFCDYIAKITGFDSKNDMFNDANFMRNYNAFVSAIDASVVNRNNASHGGTLISVNQCESDRKSVLNELEMVRSDSLGLIQQLVFLLKKN